MLQMAILVSILFACLDAYVADTLFRVIEMQAIAVELVENFRFSIPDDKPEIIRVPTMTMGPMIKGKMHEGYQMPLHVVPI